MTKIYTPKYFYIWANLHTYVKVYLLRIPMNYKQSD